MLTVHALEEMFQQQTDGDGDIISIPLKHAKGKSKRAHKEKAKKVPETKLETGAQGEGATLDLLPAGSTHNVQGPQITKDAHKQGSTKGIAAKGGAMSPQPGNKRKPPPSPGNALDKTCKRARTYSSYPNLAEQPRGTYSISRGKDKSQAAAIESGNIQQNGINVDDPSFEPATVWTVPQPPLKKIPFHNSFSPQASSLSHAAPNPKDNAACGAGETHGDNSIAPDVDHDQTFAPLMEEGGQNGLQEDKATALRKLRSPPTRIPSSHPTVDHCDPPARPVIKNPFASTQNSSSAHRSATAAYPFPRRPTDITTVARGLSPVDVPPRNPIAPANPGSLANTRVSAVQGSRWGKARK